MSLLDSNEKAAVDKMLLENPVEDFTKDIRERSHSKLITEDRDKLIALKHKYSRLASSNKKQFVSICENQCKFLYDNYNSIFNSLLNDKLDMVIFDKFIEILENIENGLLSQHEGSYLIGKYLKNIYVDKKIKTGTHDNKTNKSKKTSKANADDKSNNDNTNQESNISYKQFKKLKCFD